MERQIVLLANSAKHGSYCAAGIDVENQNWIRLVGDDTGKEISWDKFNIKPSLLSILEVKIEKQVPIYHQTENYIVKPDIKIVGQFEKEQLDKFVQNPDDLWGVNNSISLEEIKKNNISSSLYFIKVDKIQLYLKYYNSESGQSSQRRAIFLYNGIKYDLPLTDLQFGDKNLYPKDISNAYLVISLGGAWGKHNHCYKIVAGIIS